LELKYSHVENIVLAVMHVVQRFCHYILLHETTIVSIMNLFQYVLTRCIIGRKISRWIVILQEFDLDFVSAKSKNSLVFVELISKVLVKLGDVTPKESSIKGDLFPYFIFKPLVWRYTSLSIEFEVPCLCFSQ
jgi:hypothetical protein